MTHLFASVSYASGKWGPQGDVMFFLQAAGLGDYSSQEQIHKQKEWESVILEAGQPGWIFTEEDVVCENEGR